MLNNSHNARAEAKELRIAGTRKGLFFTQGTEGKDLVTMDGHPKRGSTRDNVGLLN